jgi:hypothetical protein
MNPVYPSITNDTRPAILSGQGFSPQGFSPQGFPSQPKQLKSAQRCGEYIAKSCKTS